MNKTLSLLKNSTAITLSFALIVNPISSAWASGKGEKMLGLEEEKESARPGKKRPRNASAKRSANVKKPRREEKSTGPGKKRQRNVFDQKSDNVKEPRRETKSTGLSKKEKKKANDNYILGMHYYYEEPRDLAQAKAHFLKAKKHGHPKANKYLAKIQGKAQGIDEESNTSNSSSSNGSNISPVNIFSLTESENVEELLQTLKTAIAAIEELIKSDPKGEAADSSNLKETLGQLQEAFELTKANPSLIMGSPDQLDHLTERMTTLLTKQVAKIESYFQKEIDGFKARIDGLVEEGMQPYTLIAWIKWAVGGTATMAGGAAGGVAVKGAALGAAAGVKAVGTTFVPLAAGVGGLKAAGTTFVPLAAGVGGLKAVGGVAGAGGVAGGVAGAGAAIAATTVPILIVGIMGGGVAVFLYKKDKDEHQKKITDEFKKTEVEKIKLDLRSCARELRKMRFYGVDGNFLKKDSFLPTLDLSDIKTTFNLLSCLYRIAGDHNGTRFVQDIWQPTFSTLENTLRYYARESGQFYEKGPKLLTVRPKLKFLAQDFEEEFRVLMQQIKENNKLSHIPEGFIQALVTNYLEEQNADQNVSLTGSPLPPKKLKKFVKYMEFCRHIYTDETTRGFVTNHMESTITEERERIIRNTREIDELYSNLLEVQKQWNNIPEQPSLYENRGIYKSEQVSTLPRDDQRQKFQADYENCIREINSFLQEILNKDPINHKEIEEIGFAVRQLKVIQQEIHKAFLWHFSTKQIEASIPSFVDSTDNSKEYPLTSEAVVSASFLNKTQLLDKSNISVLSVGFRNLESLKGIFNITKEQLLAFKRNRQAYFSERGEVDHIAYIKKGTESKEGKDKLVIVFSGSNSSRDWVTNVTMGYTPGIGRLSVHRGIGELFMKSGSNYCNLLMSKIRDYYKNNPKPTEFKIVTSGHSLGGAEALLAAYYYMTTQMQNFCEIFKPDKVKISVKTFMFGPPAIADEPSQMAIEEALGGDNIFRIWTFDDPVVALSGKFYRHVGESFLLDNIANNKFDCLDKLWGPHLAERYLCYLHWLQEPSESHTELTSVLKKYMEDNGILAKQDWGTYAKAQSKSKGEDEEKRSSDRKEKEEKKKKRGRNNTSPVTASLPSEPDRLRGYDYRNLNIPLRADINGLHILNNPLNPVVGQRGEVYDIDGQNFRLQNVSGDNMRCFFNAAGLDPDAQIKLLRENRNNSVVRYMIANEIVSAARTSWQIPYKVREAVNYALYEAQRGQLDRLEESASESTDQNPEGNQEALRRAGKEGTTILEELRHRALSLGAFNAFIDHHIGGNHMMATLHDVRGNNINDYTSIDAIAYINNMGIRIYQPNGGKELHLAHEFIPEGATEVVYLYHEGIHFQALIPEYEEKDLSSSKTKVTQNLPGDPSLQDELEELKAKFLTGELPEEMREENYISLRTSFELARSNIDALVNRLNDNYFSDGERKNPEDLKKYLVSLVENNPANKNYLLINLENLSKLLEEESRLSQEIEQCCRRQLKGKAKN